MDLECDGSRLYSGRVTGGSSLRGACEVECQQPAIVDGILYACNVQIGAGR
jgi:hypothetical protein